MKKEYFLNGEIKLDFESIGPFSVYLDFDEELAGYNHKKGIYFTIIDENIRFRLEQLRLAINSKKQLRFVANYGNYLIELLGFSPESFQDLPISQINGNNIANLGEFNFHTFIRRDKKINENFNPFDISFLIEDLVLFRPTLKGTSNFLGIKDESKIEVNLDEFENTLYFETNDFFIETNCIISAPVTLRNRYDFSVSTKPILLVKSKKPEIKEEEIFDVGENLLLILSFLEERFINYIGITLSYNLEKDSKVFEFRHTHYSEPMKEPWRHDLKTNHPMDKFTFEDINAMYLSYKKLQDNPKVINFSQIIYLYLNAIKAKMVYYPIINYYACVEKLIEVAKASLKNFSYLKGTPHKEKVEKLCNYLDIDFSDLLDKNGIFGYIQIRHDYNHKLTHNHEIEDIIDAKNEARYLCRRLIFGFLGLDYQNYNSCDPKKYGRIGL